MTRKKLFLIISACVVAIVAALVAWNKLASPTRIAFVNYQPITLGEIGRANNNSFIKIERLEIENLSDASTFDMVFVNGMGLRLTDDERRLLAAAAESGTPILTTAATNPDNLIISTDSVSTDALKQYLSGGGRENYRSMLNYVRTNIDGKSLFRGDISEAQAPASGLLYHPEGNDGMRYFDSLADYREYLAGKGILKAGAPEVILTGMMGVPDELIARLEESGNVVYPISIVQKAIASGVADSISPSAMINMAHGRLGDMAVEYLRRKNIPLFAPLNVNRDYDEWMADKMGMNGGFMSQSIVTPEIDGAIRPWTLFAQFNGNDGVPEIKAIPGRLEEFVETVNNYTSLRNKPNGNKKLAIFYFKGPGQNALVAEGMEVAPSLFNLLTSLKAEGYKVDNLPESAEEFERLLNSRGRVFGAYAVGAMEDFIANCNPELISGEDYRSWVETSLGSEMAAEVESVDGEFPGSGMKTPDGRLALARLEFGNVVLIPQPAAGIGDDEFKIVHGTDMAPPHAYVAAYLWARHGFDADAIMHFGAHGSLEFTPRKQVALGSRDWSDRLIGTLPHVYVYSTGNVGEAMMAKRRSYAGIVNYLTPPFIESNVRGTYKNLTDAINSYNREIEAEQPNRHLIDAAAKTVKKFAVELGIHRELRLDSVMSLPYRADEIARIENFAEELANEKITGEHYVMGRPYTADEIASTTYAMTVDPIAYNLFVIDKLRGRAQGDYSGKGAAFSRRYVAPARALVGRILGGKQAPDRSELLRMAGLTEAEAAADNSELAAAFAEFEQAVGNVSRYSAALASSPANEMAAVVNALNGGFTAPTPGGDPVLNPMVLPTGRNMFAVNAELTPSVTAWEKGKALAENTLKLYGDAHNDSLPRKVSYTLWSSEFIETEGATIAQILYMLGVEPVRDPFGRVTDLRLIPSEELGRPRIDVVVQTSGQLRDLAASRLFLISRAVEMAANAADDSFDNYVAEGVVESERHLVNKGVSPKEARKMSTERVFGGVNGNYGTGIQEMVEAGDRWDDRSRIAETYINNMGASYGSEKDWEKMRDFAFEAALTRTDVVVQPRQSNTWGALSLDHVYEFMGGMNLAVATVTGKEPDAYLADYRNRNRNRMQEVKEAIGVESRTTILNPTYIKEKMRGGAGDASAIADVVRNTYGWNVMKADVIDNELWNDIYDTYVKDTNNLGTKEYFTSVNPAALEEITAVMLETVRKGMWSASDEQVAELARLHTEVVNRHEPSCSGFVCNNPKLREFIASKTDAQAAATYNEAIANIRAENNSGADGMVMQKDELNSIRESETLVSGGVVAAIVAVGLLVVFVVIRRRRKNEL